MVIIYTVAGSGTAMKADVLPREQIAHGAGIATKSDAEAGTPRQNVVVLQAALKTKTAAVDGKTLDTVMK